MTRPAVADTKLKIIVGGDHENPPYEFIENGRPTGFNVELMQAVADAVGADVEFRLGPWSVVRSRLEQGKIDALAGMYYSEERGKAVDFSLPHTMVTAGLFVRHGSPIHSAFDMKGKEVIVQKGDVIDDYLRKEGTASRLIEVENPADVLRLLASGMHDCALMPSRFQGEYLLKSLRISNISALSADLPQFRYCFAVKKGNTPLRYRLDEGLNILKVSGRYQEIYNKWFGVYEKGRLWRTVRYFVWALAVIAGLLAAISIWSWVLRREVAKRTAELRESEEKFRVLADTSPVAICLIQGERHVYVNQAMLNKSGYTEQEFMETSFWGFTHEEYRDLVKERGLARQRGEQVPSPYEIKWLTRDGEEKWALLSAGRIEYRGAPAIIATLFDITDRKRMEDELRAARDGLEKRVVERTAELRRAKELLEEEIIARNRTERVITARLRLLELAATQSLEGLLEATVNEAEALTGSSIGFFHFLEADQETLTLQNWSTRTKGEFCKAEGQGLHYDISLAGVWTDCIHERRPVIHNDYASLAHRRGMPPDHAEVVRELVLPVFRGDSIVAIIGVGNKPLDYTNEDVEAITFLTDIAWDIAERKQAEEALLLSQFCIDKAGIGIYQSDETGAIFSVNEHACNSLGYSREELCRLTVFDIDPVITREKMLQLNEILDERQTATFHTTHRRRDGSTFPVEITANHLDFQGKRYGISFVKDITERREAEEALRESEARVRRKLESILDPEGDVGELELADIIDAPQIQALMDDLYRNTGLKMSIIDLKGQVLVDVGWQDICLKFHRVHPGTREGCRESDTILTEGVPRGEFKTYKCRNNMWHLVTPIFVGERHMGNLFMGQFFFENEELDYDLFRAQARKYGFPEEEYIAALEAVPRHSEENIDKGKDFFLRFIDMFSRLSYGNIKLARALAERDRLTARLAEANMVVENSPVVLFRCKSTPGWPVELVSGNVVQFGYTPEEFLSGKLTYSSIVYPQDLPGLIAETEDYSAASREQWQQEYRILTKGGEIRWIIDETDCERDKNGEVTHYEGIIIDVTDRKLAEEQLRENLQLLQTMMRNAPIILYGVDRNGIFTLSEGKGLAGMALKPGETVGRSVFDVYRGMPGPLDNFRRALAGESFVAPIRVGDRIYDAYHEPMFDDNGEYDGTLGVLVDVTEQRRAEEELREANLVVENSPVVLFRWQSDDEWPVELVSGNIIQFGYTPDEFLSRSITYSSIIHPDDLERVTREVHDFCNEGVVQFRLEYRIFTK
ncbi:MAG TPA: PAS domain S-box protein, partial [Geobacteraceae bacterium]